MAVSREWNKIRDQLEKIRAGLNDEIQRYPSPIAGCDAQFNYLLSRRRQIEAELAGLESARRNSQTSPADFVAMSLVRDAIEMDG